MIKLDKVSFTYPGQDTPVIEELSIEIAQGEFVAIMGSNGSGKTTLCKLLNGIIPQFIVGDILGEVEVAGMNVREHTVSELSQKVGYVYQDFENAIVRPKVIDEICFTPLNYGVPDYRERGERIIKLLELEKIKHEYIWQLSGGQKHMVALGAALSMDPDIIIVDEPVAQLDPFHARKTYEWLKYLNEVCNKTIIVIEHHTEFIAEYCTAVLLLDKGKVKWKKSVQKALTSLEDLRNCNIFPPQVTQVAYGIVGKEEGNLPINLEQGRKFLSSIQKNNKCPKRSLAKIQAKVHQKDEDLNTIPITVSFEEVTSGYKDGNKQFKSILDRLNINFYMGERIAVVGGNGAGKSTFLKHIAKLTNPPKGEVRVLGKNLGRISTEEVAEWVSYITQNPEEMLIEDSIKGDVGYFLKARKVAKREEKVADILHQLDLYDIQDKDGRLLSGGQQRRVSLAIGLGMTPEIVLLDEPTASLDIVSRKELLNILELLKETIKTTIIATHDMQLVLDWATRVVVLHKGSIIFDGESHTLFREEEILSKAHLIPPQIAQLYKMLGLQEGKIGVKEMIEYYSHKEVKRCP